MLSYFVVSDDIYGKVWTKLGKLSLVFFFGWVAIWLAGILETSLIGFNCGPYFMLNLFIMTFTVDIISLSCIAFRIISAEILAIYIDPIFFFFVGSESHLANLLDH